jgi:hypothetical protein
VVIIWAAADCRASWPDQAMRPGLCVLWLIERKDSAMKLGSGETQMKKVLSIAALGMAGFCGVAACGSAVQASNQPRPLSAAPTAASIGLARDIAKIASGNVGLDALDNGEGRAAMAYCDPGTVSGRPGAGTPVSASCGVNYSDGAVWQQTVTVTFDSHGRPVADGTNLGSELLPPISG